MAAISDFFDGMHGVIFPFGGTTAPAGFLMCDGKEYSRLQYPALYAVLLTRFGSSDGDQLFKVPDLRGRVIAGVDNMGGTAAGRLTTAGSGVNGAVLGADGGEQAHTLTVPEIPAHTHADSRYTGTNPGAGSPVAGTGATAVIGQAQGGSTGGGLPHNNVQPTLVLNYIIKT
ncbi:phage tail protein [Geminicoccus harenae]|uniref:phage tail protein n=1 Tax=Geminicoccus harenae TaxID=2498453 RepID=UPI00168B82CB|nr:tail fiber protein [Geminicoccus harenae]